MTLKSPNPLHLSIGDKNLWQSLCMIPVVRYLLQKKLDSLESSNEITDEQDANTSEQVSSEEVAAYWQTYQHWQQADLNPKQQEWMQEIHSHLNSLQQNLFKSRSLASPTPASSASATFTTGENNHPHLNF